ncbi:dihydrofolate reductase family protein [Actinophytocola sediminis]
MRKIIVSVNMSLDGDTDHMEEWHFQYFQEEAQKIAQEQLFASDALLLGRETYVAFAEVWPGMAEQAGEFGERMNALPHYVVSTTLTEQQATWQPTTIIRDDVVDTIAALKAQPGKDILIYGYGRLAHTLSKAGLLDEIRVWLHPVFSGHGDPKGLLYRDGTNIPVELAHTRTLGCGIVILTYRAATAPQAG